MLVDEHQTLLELVASALYHAARCAVLSVHLGDTFADVFLGQSSALFIVLERYEPGAEGSRLHLTLGHFLAVLGELEHLLRTFKHLIQLFFYVLFLHLDRLLSGAGETAPAR